MLDYVILPLGTVIWQALFIMHEQRWRLLERDGSLDPGDYEGTSAN